MKILLNRVEIKAILFSLLVVFAIPAMAQDEDAKVFVPTSAWLVGPASLDQDSAASSAGKMPCVVANQFSNGYVVRFSGGGDQLMAMAVDFRQKVFTPREKYDVEFAIPGKFFQVLSGAAYDEGTLLFGLYKFPEFYKALQKGDTLTVKASGTTIAINLAGLNDGFRRMNECFNPDKVLEDQRPAKQASTQKSSHQNPLLSGDGSGLTPMPEEKELPPPPAPPAERIDPEASVNAVLNNGGSVSPAGGSASTLIANAQEAQKAAKDLDARSPIKEATAGKPMSGTWSQPDQPKTLRPNGSEIMESDSPSPKIAMNGTQTMRWRAVKGADLHDILDSWAAGSGVKLMWMAKQSFAVDRSISISGDFSTAAKAILEEYADKSTRPVGRIYHEPGSAQLVLVIEQTTENRE